MTKWPWLLVACLWLWTTHAIMQTSQGLYEDSSYVIGFQHQPPPSTLEARGLSRWTLWYQINHDLTPQNIRAWNVRLGLLVALAVGVLASQLGICAWAATGLMIVHPLTAETLAMMSGRMELIAALGVLLACIGATSRHGWPLVLAGLALGVSGKEPAAFGVVPVLLLWRRPRWAALSAVALFAFAGWHYRAGVSPNVIPALGSWALTQSAACWRVLTLLVFPIHQTVDYDYDAVPLLWKVSASLSLITLAGVAWAIRRLPIVAGSLAAMLCVLAPRLIVETPKSYFNEHQGYLLVPAFALLFAWGVTQIQEWGWRSERV